MFSPLTDLSLKSFCDPRLNFEQSLGMLFSVNAVLPGSRDYSDVAFLISKYLKELRTGKPRSQDESSALGKKDAVYDALRAQN